MYDGVVGLRFAEGVSAVAFADDLALVIIAREELDIVAKANRAIVMVKEWLSNHKLCLAPRRTKAVILAGIRRLAPMRFTVNGHIIIRDNEIKYFRMCFDRRRSFTTHVSVVVQQAERVVRGLSRLLGNAGVPQPSKRKIYALVVTSSLLYME